MTLSAVAPSLALYALVFQAAVYFSLPRHLRTRIGPFVTGVIGAVLSVGAGFLFGFDRVGLAVTQPVVALLWGLATTVVVSAGAVLVSSRPGGNDLLADPRMARLSRRESVFQIFVRIPVFTALVEEMFFRGLLHAALVALYPIEVAAVVGAGLFGMWHIAPGIDQARSGEASVKATSIHTAVTVAATTIAGAFFVWLRIETGSIWAPAAVHAALNMTMALFARRAAMGSASSERGVVRTG